MPVSRSAPLWAHREDIAQAQADYDRAHPGRPVR